MRDAVNIAKKDENIPYLCTGQPKFQSLKMSTPCLSSVLHNGTYRTRYLFNGKELDTETNLYYYGARYYEPVTTLWYGVDPLTEKYPFNSGYVYCNANPVKYVDPDGRKIGIYHWADDGDGGGQWEKGHLNSETQKCLESFAQTKEGYEFLSQYAKAGQKIGSVEFKTDGKYSDQELSILEHYTYGAPLGSYKMLKGKNRLNFCIYLNASHLKESYGKESYALTIGHESFIHMSQVDDDLIKSYRNNDLKRFNDIEQQEKIESMNGGDKDHQNYIRGKSDYERFNTYVSQLKKIFNPNNVEKAKLKHDAKYKHLR